MAAPCVLVNMAAPCVLVDGGSAGEFESWLNARLDALEVDREVYGSYIVGVLQEEEESDEEKSDALQGILSAFLEDDALEDVCRQIIGQWTESYNRSKAKGDEDVDVKVIASLMEKQAQILVKPKDSPNDPKKNKEALLAQYANVSADEDEAEEEESSGANFPSEKSLFKNTNVEEVLTRQKQKRDQAREDSHKKKEGDKMQREKDKLAKQDRKEKEKKRTQKGEKRR